MSLRPAAIIEGKSSSDGMFVVIDDGPDYDVVLILPALFTHRRVVRREELAGMGTIHGIGSVYACTEIGCAEMLRGYAREPGFCSVCHEDLTEIKPGSEVG